MNHFNSDILIRKIDINSIYNMRKKILEEFREKSMNVLGGELINISPVDLKILFNLYDRYFFQEYFGENQMEVNFSISGRMTSAAGKTIAKGRKGQPLRDFEIRLSRVFYSNFKKMGEGRKVCGIMCRDSLEWIALVMEHELVHVIEFLLYRESSCSKKRFKLIANGLFGHTESYHKLPSNGEILKKEKGVKIGDQVRFRFKNAILEGILYKINKRAVVMVKDSRGEYGDKNGNRFKKYYVPIELLKEK